jgi:hypothetical protein
MYLVVAHYVGLISSYKMSWHYFGTGHGKEEWDGASAIVKRALRAKQFHKGSSKMQIMLLNFLEKVCLLGHLTHMRECMGLLLTVTSGM